MFTPQKNPQCVCSRNHGGRAPSWLAPHAAGGAHTGQMPPPQSHMICMWHLQGKIMCKRWGQPQQAWAQAPPHGCTTIHAWHPQGKIAHRRWGQSQPPNSAALLLANFATCAFWHSLALVRLQTGPKRGWPGRWALQQNQQLVGPGGGALHPEGCSGLAAVGKAEARRPAPQKKIGRCSGQGLRLLIAPKPSNWLHTDIKHLLSS